jgi:hypothetical protein
VTCALYQDVANPAGATTAGVTVPNQSGIFAGTFSTAATLSVFASTAAGSVPLRGVAGPDAALVTQTSGTFSVAPLAGTTVRFAILNGANDNGSEVAGFDDIHFLGSTRSWLLGKIVTGAPACAHAAW